MNKQQGSDIVKRERNMKIIEICLYVVIGTFVGLSISLMFGG